MAQAAAAAPAIAARRAVRGTALRGKSAAVKPTRSGRGASLECNAFLDQLKKAADGVTRGPNLGRVIALNLFSALPCSACVPPPRIRPSRPSFLHS